MKIDPIKTPITYAFFGTEERKIATAKAMKEYYERPIRKKLKYVGWARLLNTYNK